MTEREARIAFNMIPTVGSITLARLMETHGGSAALAYEDYPQKQDWQGNLPAWEREIELAEKMHVTILTEIDPGYPEQFRTIASPPLALYVVGDVQALAKPGIALIGTRGATGYGRDTAEKFAFGLAQRGWSVISGLARGIDASAHRGALAGGGVTIGVLGGALDQFYPQENRDLAREMVARGGCVASEFPFGRKPDVQTFPQRNRLVSGLSRGVVAIECPLHSGTLITCTRAIEQHRPVMAVPGRIDWKVAEGCLHLIREGARMVTSVDDILEEVNPLPRKVPDLPQEELFPPRRRGVDTPIQPSVQTDAEPAAEPAVEPAKRVEETATVPVVKMSFEEVAVLREVPDEGATIDAIVRKVGLPAGQVNALLVGLRLKGRIRFLPGNRVAAAKTLH